MSVLCLKRYTSLSKGKQLVQHVHRRCRLSSKECANSQIPLRKAHTREKNNGWVVPKILVHISDYAWAASHVNGGIVVNLKEQWSQIIITDVEQVKSWRRWLFPKTGCHVPEIKIHSKQRKHSYLTPPKKKGRYPQLERWCLACFSTAADNKQLIPFSWPWYQLHVYTTHGVLPKPFPEVTRKKWSATEAGLLSRGVLLLMTVG